MALALANGRYRFGTPEWLADVYNSPPARDVQGRARPTQRYAVAFNGVPSVVEGGYEAAARTLLQSSVNCGIVRRYKCQPFGLQTDGGSTAVPDFIFERSDGQNFVVEVKCSRYLTERELTTLRAIETYVEAAGLRYLLWMDCWPLTSRLWHLVRHIRRAGAGAVSNEELARVVDAVAQKSMTIAELGRIGCYLDHVFAAIWHGQAHIDLLRRVDDTSLVSGDVGDRNFDLLLTARIDSVRWWPSLRTR